LAAISERRLRVLASLSKKKEEYPIEAFTLTIKNTDLQTVAALILGEGGMNIKGQFFENGP